MADQFALLVERHAETAFWQIIFPKLAGIVEENPGNQQIKVEIGIKRRDLRGDPHHLGGVLEQTTAARMMIGARTGGVSKTRPVLCNELGAERIEPRIADRGGSRNNEFPIGRLFCAECGRALQNMRLFLGGKAAGSPSSGRRGRIVGAGKTRR